MTLIDLIAGRFRFDVRLAHWRDPMWWHIDKSGRRRVTIFGLHWSNAQNGRTPLIGLIVGPIAIRFGWLWDSCMNQEDERDRTPPHPLFAAAFNAGWEALMTDIGPLVADLRSYQELKRGEASDVVDHRMAIDRLRELVLENSEK